MKITKRTYLFFAIGIIAIVGLCCFTVPTSADTIDQLRFDLTTTQGQVKEIYSWFSVVKKYWLLILGVLGLSTWGALIVINVNNKALRPDLAKHALLSLLRTRSFFGKINYNSISACIYISEAHPEFGLLPFIVIERDRSKSKDLVVIDIKYLEELQLKWAQFRGIPLIKGTEDMLDKISKKLRGNTRPNY